jgi:competence protein ComEC
MLKTAPWCLMGWLLGTALQLQQASLWSLSMVWVAGGLTFSLCLLAWMLRTQKSQIANSQIANCVLGVLISFGLALTLVNARCLWQAQHRLDPSLEGREVLLKGVIASLPQQTASSVRFRFEVISAFDINASSSVVVPEQIDLAWFDRESAELMRGSLWADLKAGDIWQFSVRLKAPHGSLNPGGFDEAFWRWEQGVMATGTVSMSKRAEVPKKIKASWLYPIAQARQYVRSEIDRKLWQGDEQSRSLAGVIAALVMGDQAAIQASDWDLFRATGVAHLMSISGLHITLFAWVMAAVIRALWRFSASCETRLCLRWPAPHVALLAGVLLATLYALFSGWGLPSQRTVIMLWLVCMLQLIGVRWPMFWSLGLALWVVVAFDPWAMLQPGFWLSFVAVGVLMLNEPLQDAARTKMEDGRSEMVYKNVLVSICLKMVDKSFQTLGNLVREQWLVTVALTPLAVLFFGQLSWVGLLANLLAIPWVTWLVTPLAILGIFAPPLWVLASWALQPLMALLALMASLPGSVWHLPTPPIGLAVLAILGGLLLLQQWPWSLRCWGALFILPIFIWQVPRPETGQFDLWFADVGQGNAVLIRTSHHALLYDAGPTYSETSDAGQRVLVPLLQRMGVKLDRVMLSHRDADHTGGAAAVLRAHPHADLWSSLEDGHPLSNLRPVHACMAGQKWEWDGVQFELLHPVFSDDTKLAGANALSCVLRVDASRGTPSKMGQDRHMASALLAGDVEAAQELAMLERQALKPVGVLLVPHHGSQTSSTLGFIQALRPHWAVVQAGYRNRYGHPAPGVLERYANQKVPVSVSSECGAAHWQSTLPQQLDCERELRRRYWHLPSKAEPKASD